MDNELSPARWKDLLPALNVEAMMEEGDFVAMP